MKRMPKYKRERVPAIMSVDLDVSSGELQLSISDGNFGNRICGPSYIGTSKNLLKYYLNEHDCLNIRKHLDAAFPHLKGVKL